MKKYTVRTFYSPGKSPGEKGFPPSVTDQSADVSTKSLVDRFIRSGEAVPRLRYDAQSVEDAAHLVVSAVETDGFDLADIPAVLKAGAAALRAVTKAPSVASGATSTAPAGGTTPAANPAPGK